MTIFMIDLLHHLLFEFIADCCYFDHIVNSVDALSTIGMLLIMNNVMETMQKLMSLNYPQQIKPLTDQITFTGNMLFTATWVQILDKWTCKITIYNLISGRLIHSLIHIINNNTFESPELCHQCCKQNINKTMRRHLQHFLPILNNVYLL